MEDLKLVQMAIEKYNMDMFVFETTGIKSEFLERVEKYNAEALQQSRSIKN